MSLQVSPRRRAKFASARGGPVRRHSIYFPQHILAEIGAQALRLDRSLSWLVQHAWKMARAQIAGGAGTPIDEDARASE